MTDFDPEEVAVQNSLTELERNALARKERLKSFRAELNGKSNDQQSNDQFSEANDESSETNETVPLVFRSYKPTTLDAPRLDPTKEHMVEIEKKISDQLESTFDTTVNDTLDLNTLAPRKVDWDLKRSIQDKLEKLEHRTQKAISQLIRQRLEAEEDSANTVGNSDL